MIRRPPRSTLFPTRRSSDLAGKSFFANVEAACDQIQRAVKARSFGRGEAAVAMRDWSERSEEHTSELQSPCNLVCRLLLEKKKKVVSGRVAVRERMHEPTTR